MQVAEQSGQPRPTEIQKCWAGCNNGVNVIPQRYGKGGRESRTSLQQMKF